MHGPWRRESKTSRKTSPPVARWASKVALASLVDRLRARDYALLDTQWVTGHLAQFGAIEIPRRRYLRMLDEALKVDASFT